MKTPDWIYPNIQEACLRRYGTAEKMADAMGICQSRLSELMLGKHEPKKHTIDNILNVTGLTYEEAFSTK